MNIWSATSAMVRDDGGAGTHDDLEIYSLRERRCLDCSLDPCSVFPNRYTCQPWNIGQTYGIHVAKYIGLLADARDFVSGTARPSVSSD